MSRTVRTRTFVVVGLAVAMLLAGVVSYYASSHPDGLEYVAEQAGFADTAEESATADGPLADYRVKGVEDERAAGGLAGVIGAAAVLALSLGLVHVVRRRGSRTGEPSAGPTPDPATGSGAGSATGSVTGSGAASDAGRATDPEGSRHADAERGPLDGRR